jgi:hypothetical protein
MSGLHDAAVALIAEAPETTVIAVLKMLIAAIEPTPVRPLEAPLRPAPRPSPSRRAPAAAAPVDEDWEALRGQVKAAMAERGASYADVAQAIGRSDIGVRISLSTRKPPKPVVRSRLQKWIDEAPAVATPAAPFPGSNTGHRGNGHDHPAGPYSSAA